MATSNTTTNKDNLHNLIQELDKIDFQFKSIEALVILLGQGYHKLNRSYQEACSYLLLELITNIHEEIQKVSISLK